MEQIQVRSEYFYFERCPYTWRNATFGLVMATRLGRSSSAIALGRWLPPEAITVQVGCLACPPTAYSKTPIA